VLSFGTSKRFKAIDEDCIQPGPGKYSLPSTIVTAPGYLFKQKDMLSAEIIF